MKAGFEVSGRWKVIDGPDLLTIWLGCDGFYSQRVSNFNSDEPIGHKPQKNKPRRLNPGRRVPKETYMTYLAIDPGKSGGFAWNDGKKFLCAKMPETDEGITQMIAGFAEVRPIVILEKVCGFIGRNQPGSMMFSFGENFGLIKGVALAYGLRLVLVTPQKWQRATIPGTKKDFNYESVLTKGKRKGLTVTKNRWKENLVDHAVRIFPNSNVTTQTADALLILNYALQQNV